MQTNRFFPPFLYLISSLPACCSVGIKGVNESLKRFQGCGCVCGHIFLNHVTSLCDLLFLPRETSVTPFLIFVMHHQPEEKQYYPVWDIVL